VTDQESISRAERIVTLFVDKSDARHSLLVTEIARELRYTEREVGEKTLRILDDAFRKYNQASYELEYKTGDK